MNEEEIEPPRRTSRCSVIRATAYGLGEELGRVLLNRFALKKGVSRRFAISFTAMNSRATQASAGPSREVIHSIDEGYIRC